MASYAFTTFGVPGATGSSALGVNDAGEVVGRFAPSSGFPQGSGFSDLNGAFTTYDYPAGQVSQEYTTIVGVSARGVLTGFETDSKMGSGSSNPYSNFTYGNGTYTTLPVPGGAASFQVNGIDPTGTTLVGSEMQGRYTFGFTYSNGSYTTVSYPFQTGGIPYATVTTVTGINATGSLVGTYNYLGNAANGFLDVGGSFTTVDFPNAAATTPTAIDATGQIVGSFTDAAGAQHGFIDSAGTFSEIDLPGATATAVNGINSLGEIVGTATVDGVQTAFTAVPVCFVAGTLIRTARGGVEMDVPVEALRVGDLAVTASGALRPIRWLGHRTVDGRRHPRPREIWPVRVRAHAFGPGRPARDLRVSPGHALAFDVCGEVLVPALALVDGAAIVQEDVASVTYWHVELDSHDLLLAEAVPAESYLDCGNRGFFVGETVLDLAAGPDAPPNRDCFCRPFHGNGPVVEAIRERLSTRASAATEATARGGAATMAGCA